MCFIRNLLPLFRKYEKNNYLTWLVDRNTMFNKSLIFLVLSSLIFTSGCETTKTLSKQPQVSLTQQQISQASQQANQIFEDIFNASVMRNPVYQTYLGIKQDYDKWNDLSEENILKELAYAQQDLKTINAINPDLLNEQTKLSRTLYIQTLENKIADHQWRMHNYPVNQMFGTHSQIPAFLINQHLISNEKEAQDYITRVERAKVLLEQLVLQLQLREAAGIIPPKFVFPHVIRDSQNILNGAPFAANSKNIKDSTLLADFKQKLDKISLDNEKQKALIASLEKALKNHFKPGYEYLINYLTELEKKANNEAGVWKFPDGEAFYHLALKRTTTTDLSAEDIHKIGLIEVDRIHAEMRTIKEKVGFKGDLKSFMTFMREDPQFYYPNTQAGKDKYLKEAVALIETMESRLDEFFLTKPKAKLKVKAVEAFREKSAGKAFYQKPALDGSRPGIYYANLYDMSAMPTYQMEALAYHEGLPGHHMQLSISQELTGIPTFRKFGSYTAYTEGWGLYSEYIPKEVGFYQDPYSDFGRLAMELWRACRLVVDTGIHKKKWTREQGIAYYIDNTPNAKSDAVKMVERHIVMPSQATAYKVGMLKIIELRDKAKAAMGNKFDIREYHDVVLKNGALPLNILEDFVEQYIASK